MGCTFWASKLFCVLSLKRLILQETEAGEADGEAKQDAADDEHADVDGGGVEDGAGQEKHAAYQHGVHLLEDVW